jgi:lycopene cyclase domain-containing protein
MTYFGFLALFVGLPLAILMFFTWLDHRQRRPLPRMLTSLPAGWALTALVLIAVIYTTPWDNYLVATEVWWYDPALVTGFTIGWVPIEEYTFFILQTILTGVWLLWLARRILPARGVFRTQQSLRWGITLPLGVFWLLSVVILVLGWQPGTYLALILVWALPPMMVQTAFGADILWHHRRLVILGILIPTIYLGMADALAIRSGTWTISPTQTLGIFLPGSLPLEEFTFFLVTNVMIVFGITLMLARESRRRLSWVFDGNFAPFEPNDQKLKVKPIPVRKDR